MSARSRLDERILCKLEAGLMKELRLSSEGGVRINLYNDDTKPNPDPHRPSRLMKDILCLGLTGNWIDESHSLLI